MVRWSIVSVCHTSFRDAAFPLLHHWQGANHDSPCFWPTTWWCDPCLANLAPYSSGLSDWPGMAHGPNLANQNHSLLVGRCSHSHEDITLGWWEPAAARDQVLFLPPLHGGTPSVIGKSEGSPRDLKGWVTKSNWVLIFLFLKSSPSLDFPDIQAD